MPYDINDPPIEPVYPLETLLGGGSLVGKYALDAIRKQALIRALQNLPNVGESDPFVQETNDNFEPPQRMPYDGKVHIDTNNGERIMPNLRPIK